MLLVFFFFFSSRRRHTRCSRDWSSDVCSSDLAGGTSAPSNQRKADNRAKANLESAVKTVEREMASGAYLQLYVAGPEEARATFERMLPDRLKKAIAGHLSASLDSSELKHELREKVAAAVKR